MSIENKKGIYLDAKGMNILTQLTETEQTVLKLHFENNLTLEEIGKKMPVTLRDGQVCSRTRERIRQIEEKAIRKLIIRLKKAG